MTTPIHTDRKMLRPSCVVKQYSLPRDRVYSAIHSGELPAYNAGSPKKAAFLVRVADIESWLETLRFRVN